MYLLLIFLSIIGSCLAGLFGRYLGSCGSAIITTSCLFLSFLFSLVAFYEVALVGCFVYIKLATWISSEVLHVDWGFMFDSLTVSMCVVVTFISFLVHLYCVSLYCLLFRFRVNLPYTHFYDVDNYNVS